MKNFISEVFVSYKNKNIFIFFSVYTFNIVAVPCYDEAQYKINDKINYEILANKAGRSSEATIYQ